MLIDAKTFQETIELNGEYKSNQVIDIFTEEEGVLSTININVGSVVKENQQLASLKKQQLEHSIDTKNKQVAILEHWFSKVYPHSKDELAIEKHEVRKSLIEHQKQIGAHLQKVKNASITEVIRENELSRIKTKNQQTISKTNKKLNTIIKNESLLNAVKLSKELELKELINQLHNLKLKLKNLIIRSSANALVIGVNNNLKHGHIVEKNTYLATLKRTIEPYIEIKIPNIYIDSVNNHSEISCQSKGVVIPCYFDQTLYKDKQSATDYIAHLKTENHPSFLVTGHLVDVQIILKKTDALAIHRDFLAAENNQFYAYKKVKDFDTKVNIELGLVKGDYIQVLSGLAEGDVVKSLKHD